MSATRLYRITSDANTEYLVDAANPAQALRHVVRNMFSVAPAAPKEVARMVADGVKVETAGTTEDMPQ